MTKQTQMPFCASNWLRKRNLIDRILKGEGAPLADQGILRRTWPRGATAVVPQTWLIECKDDALKSVALSPGFASGLSAGRDTSIDATTIQARRTRSTLMALRSLQDGRRHHEQAHIPFNEVLRDVDHMDGNALRPSWALNEAGKVTQRCGS